MSKMALDLIRYLGEHFPGLTLDAPLFYRWPVGLRFDLGGRACTPGEADGVVQRATGLFEAVFPPEDSCTVVAQDWTGDDSRWSGFAHLSPLFDFAESQLVGLAGSGARVEVQALEEPDVGPQTLTWVDQAARGFRYELVLKGIADADHGRSPAISSRVYFVNVRTCIIVHMYDDRGLDVIASDKDALHGLYHDFNAWILDHDRARIREIFSS
jgi:hypothetical protein